VWKIAAAGYWGVSWNESPTLLTPGAVRLATLPASA